MKFIIVSTILLMMVNADLHAQEFSMKVLIGGFEKDGDAYILLYEKGQKFDIDSKVCKRVKVNIKNKVCGYKFTNLKEGSYAIMVFHDENKNGKCDTNFIGIPKEGVGSSRNHKGIPSYSKSEIILDKDHTCKILIHYI